MIAQRLMSISSSKIPHRFNHFLAPIFLPPFSIFPTKTCSFFRRALSGNRIETLQLMVMFRPPGLVCSFPDSGGLRTPAKMFRPPG